MKLAPHKDPEVIELGRTEIAAIREVSSSLVSVSLLSDDGFEIVRDAGVSKSNAVADGARFASMASSIQALSEAVARELKMGSSEYIIVAAAGGHMIQMRIPHHPIVLAAVFDTDEMLGKALTLSRRCASRIAAGLEDLAVTPATL